MKTTTLIRTGRSLVGALAALACFLVFASCAKTSGTPDLALDDIGCQGGNLYLTLINNGPGDLPDGATGLVSVAIEGVPAGEIVLDKPTNRLQGGIEKAGGKSIYMTTFTVDKIVRADVNIDFTNQIKEFHKDNNVNHFLYVAPCNLPDLVIEEMSLDKDCRLTFTLKNQGPGPIPNKAWDYEFINSCGIAVYLNDKAFACLPFIDLDSGHRLEAAGSRLTVTSEIRIDKETLVTLVADSTENVNEAEELNNKITAKLACKK